MSEDEESHSEFLIGLVFVCQIETNHVELKTILSTVLHLRESKGSNL